MLFSYTYINHDIEKLQDYLDHLFLEVWCKADAHIEYNISLLHPVLQEIINEISNDDRVPVGDYLYEPIEKVYRIFQQIDAASRAALSDAYKSNNSIENLCCNKTGYTAITYEDLKAYHVSLPKLLKEFYENLYNNVLGLKAVYSRIGKLGDHYVEFIKINDEGKCPYCGINNIKSVYSSKREAYDHYLPKGTYPFNSVNFRNLAPMCHECNSSYKLSKDPINTKPKKNPLKDKSGSKRKAFYSYSTTHEELHLEIKLLTDKVENLTPELIELKFNNPNISDEINTWLDVFGIEERFKSMCLQKNEGKYWLIQVTEEYDGLPDRVKANYTQIEFIENKIEYCLKYKYAEGNFIRAKYLEACLQAGIIT